MATCDVGRACYLSIMRIVNEGMNNYLVAVNFQRPEVVVGFKVPFSKFSMCRLMSLAIITGQYKSLEEKLDTQ